VGNDQDLGNGVLVTGDSRLHSPRAGWIALVVVCLGQLMSIVELGGGRPEGGGLQNV